MAPGTLVDSNVLLDVLTENERWLDWSSNALATAVEAGPLFINPIIYAEVSIRFSKIEDLDAALPTTDFRRLALPWESSFLAGKVSSTTDERRGRSRRLCRTSSSAPMPPSPSFGCSHT